MFKATIENEKDLKIEKYFSDTKEMKKFLMTFVNPIKENSWMEKYSKRIGIPFKEYVESYFDETLAYIEKHDSFSTSGTIMNGENNQSKENFEFSIKRITPIDNYIQPLAWGEGLKIAEVFPEDYRELERTFQGWISKIEEDCMDSYRIGLIDSEESMKQYETFISCCGRINEEVKVNGKKYMFGCNFGH